MVKKGHPRKMKSKRMTCRMKYKIEKKVKEHKRKAKRDEKKKGKRRPKKDPGIPNLAPFKEAILKEAEERKHKAEEERNRQKEERYKEFLKKRKLDQLQKDAERRQKEYEKKTLVSGGKSLDASQSQDVESSRKAYYKEFKKVLEASDVVIQVLDARDPIGSRCVQLEQAVLASGTNKKLVLLLNKIDLVPRDITEKWLKHLRNEFPAIAFKASTQTQRTHLSQSKVPVKLSTSELMQSSHCLGADALIKLLNNYCRNAGIKTSITVGIVGFPNVGKSSIINSLKRSKACTVGAMPGVTKAMQEVQLAKNIKLLDSPGVVMATGNSETAMILRNCVKLETVSDSIAPVEAILKRCNKQSLMLHYSIPDFSSPAEFLSLMARRFGKLKKGGVVDVENAAKTVLQDWNSGKISYFTHPPEQHTLPSHLDASIVSQLGKEFDVASLVKEDEKMLKGLISKQPGASFQIDSVGSMDGVMEEEDLGTPDQEEEEEDMGGEEEEGDDDEDDEDESDEMEDGEQEEEGGDLKEVTVSLSTSSKTGSNKESPTSLVAKAKAKAKVAQKQKAASSKGNQQVNRSAKLAFKKMLKKRRRSDKLATNLSNELTQAFDFFSSGRGDSDDDDSYSFKKDFF